MAKKTRAEDAPEDKAVPDTSPQPEETPEAADAVDDAVAEDTPDPKPVDTDAADEDSETEAEDDTAQADTDEADTKVDASDENRGADDDQQEPVIAPVPVVQPERSERRSITLPLVFGGVIAAMLGFILARSDLLEPILPPGLRLPGPDGELQAQLDATQDRIAALEAELANLPEPALPEPVDLGPLEQRLEQLADEIDTLAARPVVEGALPEGALDAALQDLRATTERQQAEIAALIEAANSARDSAEAQANAARARAAVARIITALNSGAPYADEVAELREAGQNDLAPALTGPADSGVAALSTLQADAPDAARAALAAARRAEGGGGLGGFLQQQLGTRSVQPREGDDPDAVLSRVEAAARSGDLGTALTEAEALPDPARDAMADWLGAVRTRHEAVTAAQDLADTLSAL